MRYKEFYSTKKQGVAEGLEQKFKFYYSVFTHDEMQDFKERDQLDASGSPLVDMDEDEIIISASSVSEAYQKLLQHFPNQAVFVHSSTPIEQGVAEGNTDEILSEKSKSKAQQRFFGMTHALQKGEKIPGASKELTKVAKTMGKKDVKDFAKTKRKGLPAHVKKD